MWAILDIKQRPCLENVTRHVFCFYYPWFAVFRHIRTTWMSSLIVPSTCPKEQARKLVHLNKYVLDVFYEDSLGSSSGIEPEVRNPFGY